MVSIAAIFLIGGCLEKTTDEIREIDPRFVELPATVAESGGLGGGSVLDEMEGERLVLTMTIAGQDGIPVDVDIRGEGGKNLGKWVFPGPGDVEKEIPVGLGELQIQGFQDLTSDGPSDDDPFGWVDLLVEDTPISGVILEMEVGGKLKHAQSMGHVGVGPDQAEGPSVSLNMKVTASAEQAIDLDFRGPSGLVHKAILDGPGDHSIRVPAGLGEVVLQAFQDLTADGPSDDDPFAWVEIEVGSESPPPLLLSLRPGAKLELAQNMGHGSTGNDSPAQAFTDHEGGWTLLKGDITGGGEGAVQVDFRVPDPSEPGGNRFLGRTQLPSAGRYQLQVPRGMGALRLEVFQDPGSDGPSDDDPYAVLEIEVEDANMQRVSIELQEGTRGQPSSTADAGASTQSAEAPQQSVFGSLGDDPLWISGTLSLEGVDMELAFVDLDLFAPDTSAPGGRRYLGKMKQKTGAYRFQAPRNFGSIELEAFGDVDGDGPTPGDPFGRFNGNPLTIGEEALSGIDIVLRPS